MVYVLSRSRDPKPCKPYGVLLPVLAATVAHRAEAQGPRHALETQISHSDEGEDYDGDIPAAHCMPKPKP